MQNRGYSYINIDYFRTFKQKITGQRTNPFSITSFITDT